MKTLTGLGPPPHSVDWAIVQNVLSGLPDDPYRKPRGLTDAEKETVLRAVICGGGTTNVASRLCGGINTEQMDRLAARVLSRGPFSIPVVDGVLLSWRPRGDS